MAAQLSSKELAIVYGRYDIAKKDLSIEMSKRKEDRDPGEIEKIITRKNVLQRWIGGAVKEEKKICLHENKIMSMMTGRYYCPECKIYL